MTGLLYWPDWRPLSCGQWVCMERHLFADHTRAYKLVEPVAKVNQEEIS